MSNEMVRTVQFASDFVEQIATRDANGNRLMIDWGEPDEHGYWTPTVTVDYDDNIVAAERRETVERIRAAFVSSRGDYLGSPMPFDMSEVNAILDAEAER